VYAVHNYKGGHSLDNVTEIHIIRAMEQHNSALERAIKSAGGVSKLAKALQIHHSNVSHWREWGRVPPRQAIAIERLYPAIKAVDLDPNSPTVSSTEAGTLGRP